MPELSQPWECPECHGKYTNVITTERADSGKAGAHSVPYSCLNCGHTTSISASPSETIVALRTFPEAKS